MCVCVCDHYTIPGEARGFPSQGTTTAARAPSASTRAPREQLRSAPGRQTLPVCPPASKGKEGARRERAPPPSLTLQACIPPPPRSVQAANANASHARNRGGETLQPPREAARQRQPRERSRPKSPAAGAAARLTDVNDRIRQRRFPGSSPAHGHQQSERKNFHLLRVGRAERDRRVAIPSEEESLRSLALPNRAAAGCEREPIQPDGEPLQRAPRHFGGRPGITRVAGSCCSKSIQPPGGGSGAAWRASPLITPSRSSSPPQLSDVMVNISSAGGGGFCSARSPAPLHRVTCNPRQNNHNQPSPPATHAHAHTNSPPSAPPAPPRRAGETSSPGFQNP